MSDERNDILSDEVRELRDGQTWPGGRDNTANLIGEKRELSETMSDADAKRAMSRRSRRGFIVGGAAALIGIFGWRWMSDETKYRLLRGTFEFNELVSQSLYSPKRLAPEFPPSRITPERVNGDVGLISEFDAANWRLRVGGLYGTPSEIELTLDDIRKLPRTEMTTELKCIEGWSIIVKWTGVRFSDFVAKYRPIGGYSYTTHANRQDQPPYVALTTPDEQYYVGWDIESMLHPQTLLAYEMNGAPLTLEHGAPLRLASPLKYGIKQIKRIGRIEFTNERPRDFWGEQGYDWYSGH
ncbi:MAG TPA: molybdopterin-dependent oxidoreductase [Pyrinomonadaceae bacterium]|jgi:DMSO/TMAO reductase YedYZ molybdopterin-dependent catalytic subunit|nr:molybdopterin-dependent oxidoreductase [Pyrinomonadaceae bacterium]